MTQWFKGIDFANRQQNIGVCYLEVVGQTLKAHYDNNRREVEGMGIDCPFGTSLGFVRLLNGQAPNYKSNDGYKTRHTERWLRTHLWEYQTNLHWRKNIADNPQHYVNQTAHVQPTLGLQIVPGFMDWFQHEVGNVQYYDTLEASRRGENKYVEAHPRAFLYSVVERIWRSELPLQITNEVLRAVVQYKDKPKECHAAQRRTTYQLLQQRAADWIGQGYGLADPPEALIATDHAFDAWLSAVTAFAHSKCMTIAWQDAGISAEEVNVEGHILVLSQSGSVVVGKSKEGARG